MLYSSYATVTVKVKQEIKIIIQALKNNKIGTYLQLIHTNLCQWKIIILKIIFKKCV